MEATAPDLHAMAAAAVDRFASGKAEVFRNAGSEEGHLTACLSAPGASRVRIANYRGEFLREFDAGSHDGALRWFRTAYSFNFSVSEQPASPSMGSGEGRALELEACA